MAAHKRDREQLAVSLDRDWMSEQQHNDQKQEASSV
jgi:hypothetical protein